MSEFLQEGGPVIWVILAIGVAALLLELQRGVLWFVVRNHSPASLAKNTPTPLYLAAATMSLGLLGAALDYYVIFRRWNAGVITEEMVHFGLKEPLPCIIVAGTLATVIVLAHGALQSGLRAIRVPQT